MVYLHRRDRRVSTAPMQVKFSQPNPTPLFSRCNSAIFPENKNAQDDQGATLRRTVAPKDQPRPLRRAATAPRPNTPQQHNTPQPGTAPAPINPDLRRRRAPPPAERTAPPAAPLLPPVAPRRRPFGLRAQWCPGYGTSYSDGVGPAAPDARRRGHLAPFAPRSLRSNTPRPRVPAGSVAGLSRSVALAPHDGRTAPAVPYVLILPPPGFGEWVLPAIVLAPGRRRNY